MPKRLERRDRGAAAPASSRAACGSGRFRAAVEAAPDIKIAGVTVLTSLSPADLEGIGMVGPVQDVVRRLAVLAVGAGAALALGAVRAGPRPTAAAERDTRESTVV